jgi:hypothetical protein
MFLSFLRGLFGGHSDTQAGGGHNHSHSHSHSHGETGGGWTNENVHLYEQQPIASEIGDK